MNDARDKILIIGSRGHAKVIIDLIETLKIYNIVGLIDDFRVKGEIVEGYKIIGGIKDISRIVMEKNVFKGVIAIGDNFVRNKEYLAIRSMSCNFEFVTLIHPSATIAKSTFIDEGTVILAGTTINTLSNIGKFCIVNTKASIDHDCQMDDFSSAAPGVTIGGYSKIGAFSAICIGAVIKDKITIGEQAVVGAGSLVLKDIPGFKTAYGTPARIVRDRIIGERYLD